MTKRFKSYKKALELLRNPTTGASAGNPPTGSILEKYKQWRGGEVQVSYPRSQESKQISILDVSIHPFGLSPTATNLAIVGFSQRVSSATGNLANIKTACNHSPVDLDAHAKRVNFRPAKAIVFVPEATQSTTEVASQITGVRYDPREGASYTFPYGQKTGATTEGEVRTDIQTAVATIAGATVSYKSENF